MSSRRLDPKDLGRAFARGPRTQIDFLLPPKVGEPAPAAAATPGPALTPAPTPTPSPAPVVEPEAASRRKTKRLAAGAAKPKATRRRKSIEADAAPVEPGAVEAQAGAASVVAEARIEPAPIVEAAVEPAPSEPAVAVAEVEPPAVAVAEVEPPAVAPAAPPALAASTETTSTLESSTRIQRVVTTAVDPVDAPPLETSCFSRTLHAPGPGSVPAGPATGWSATGAWGAIPAPPPLEPTFEEEAELDFAVPPIEVDSLAALLAAPFEAELELARLRSQVLARPATAPDRSASGRSAYDPAVPDLDWTPGVPPLELRRGLRARLARGLDRVLARGFARLLGRIG